MMRSDVRGFTLIEIIIVIVLVGILAGVAASIISEGVRAYSDEQTRGDVHYQARVALERMAREIRQIRSRADISVMTDTDFRFIDTSGAPVGFVWAGPSIMRWDGAGSAPLANNISAFDFNYYQQDGVTPAAAATLWFVDISFTSLQGGESLQMSTRVHPRNF